MRFGFFLSKVFAGALLLSTAVPALAQEAAPSVAPGKKFELSAMMNAKAQLSRTEVDPTAVGAVRAMVPTAAMAPSAGIPNQLSMPPMQAPGIGMGPLTGRSAQQDDPNGYLNEYNVDWSRWVSTLADRWFYILRNTEYTLGLKFDTLRPALIQFTCYADGTIGNVSLKQSSGVPVYDRLQVETLLASPVPAFPSGTKRQSITLVQGWESHRKREGEQDYQPGSFGKGFPMERVRQWMAGR